MRIIFILLFVFSLSYTPYSYSMLNEQSETILTQNDLDKLDKKSINDEKIVFSGSFEGEDIWDNLGKKIPNVRDLSLKFVNQPTFRTEESRQAFLAALQYLTKLKKLSLENQFFTDEHLSKIPNRVEMLDLSNTNVYGLEHLPKNIKVIGIKDAQEANVNEKEVSLMIGIIIQNLKQFDKKEAKILLLKGLEQEILKLIQYIETGATFK